MSFDSQVEPPVQWAMQQMHYVAPPNNASEDDADHGCSVCHYRNGPDGDNLVYCDAEMANGTRCDVLVHQCRAATNEHWRWRSVTAAKHHSRRIGCSSAAGCYGIELVPGGEVKWYCVLHEHLADGVADRARPSSDTVRGLGTNACWYKPAALLTLAAVPLYCPTSNRPVFSAERAVVHFGAYWEATSSTSTPAALASCLTNFRTYKWHSYEATQWNRSHPACSSKSTTRSVAGAK